MFLTGRMRRSCTIPLSRDRIVKHTRLIIAHGAASLKHTSYEQQSSVLCRMSRIFPVCGRADCKITATKRVSAEQFKS